MIKTRFYLPNQGSSPGRRQAGELPEAVAIYETVLSYKSFGRTLYYHMPFGARQRHPCIKYRTVQSSRLWSTRQPLPNRPKHVEAPFLYYEQTPCPEPDTVETRLHACAQSPIYYHTSPAWTCGLCCRRLWCPSSLPYLVQGRAGHPWSSNLKYMTFLKSSDAAFATPFWSQSQYGRRLQFRILQDSQEKPP
jgi:hypothetical protein